MKIIISPAKKMNVENDLFTAEGTPCYLKETALLMRWIQGLTFEEAKKLWACNDQIAALNFQRFQDMNLHRNRTPAVLAYEGIQYQYMAPNVFTQNAWDYIQEHLRILSGFYGVLKPLDGVIPYRLEMQAKASAGGTKNLYKFWGDKLYKEVMDDSRTVINLASKEYSRCIETHLKPEDRLITCIFGEWKNGKTVQKGTQVKMARGEMVRFMAETQAQQPEDLKGFDSPSYSFCEDLSSENEYIFLKK